MGGTATGGNPVGGSAGQGGVGGTGATTGGASGGECGPSSPTNLVGTLRDPAGQMPLYGALVYVPMEPLPELPAGITCEFCPLFVPPSFSAALTDAAGNFRISAPPGENVPLVFQVGKWRRAITVPFVAPCVDNVIDDREATRLPRTQSEGNMPRIAVVTGYEDSVECFLRRVGIADSEFTTATRSGAVHLYVGCDGGMGTGADRFSSALGTEPFLPASTLFGIPDLLASYDFVLLGCEGSACESDKEPYLENLEAYADGGGRLFLDHHQGYWLKSGPESWRGLASFRSDDGTTPGFLAAVDRTFPKGDAFATWLMNAGASESLGELPIRAGASVEAVAPAIRRWLYAGGNEAYSLTAHVPVAAPERDQCGRIVFNDFHAMAGAFDSPDVSRSEIPFPSGCIPGPHTPQEAVMEFHLFDMPSCIQNHAPPMPPQ